MFGRVPLAAFLLFVAIVVIKHYGGIEGWIEPASQVPQTAFLQCMNLSENREKMECMAQNCLYDKAELNARHCTPR